MFRTRSDRRKEAVQIVAHARDPITMAVSWRLALILGIIDSNALCLLTMVL